MKPPLTDIDGAFPWLRLSVAIAAMSVLSLLDVDERIEALRTASARQHAVIQTERQEANRP